eukprot:CAMPEP_0182452690 /NCGR_PEP_ID=MMETSP1319-20130603/40_1 /TAXON_ID=172717 /ORGANISM="Bolidomonas pacifica, Strain RCC208" /LENGTH=119 /DNA_ID=CAMNT_0024650539 /DNA_START=118 /DNA_END=477 /DNA_ORIENTATION=-
MAEDGSNPRRFPHALVAGIDRYPRKITRAHGVRKTKKRSKVKPFIKYVNLNHVFPTRYIADIPDLKKIVDDGAMTDADSRTEARKAVKAAMERRYSSQNAVKTDKKSTGTRYLFQKLRF